jgi:hypothetical protein
MLKVLDNSSGLTRYVYFCITEKSKMSVCCSSEERLRDLDEVKVYNNILTSFANCYVWINSAIETYRTASQI